MAHHVKPIKPQPPRDKIYLQAGDPDRAEQFERFLQTSSRQPFVSQIDLTVSSCATSEDGLPLDRLPAGIRDLIAQHTFQHACLDPSTLLSPLFMNSYVREGSLVALSCGDSSGDVIALDGRGRLVLSLQKDTYETLGILGTPSRFAPKRQRHYVEVDLREPGMRAGKPGYERLKRSLHKFGELDMMFSFYDAQGQSQPLALPEGTVSRRLRPKVEAIPCTIDASGTRHELTSLGASISESKKRKRTDLDGNAAASLDVLEALHGQSVDTDASSDSVSVSLSGFLHPMLARRILATLSAETSVSLASLTTSTIPHSPVRQSLVRQPSQSKSKKRTPWLDERDTDGDAMHGTTSVLWRGADEKKGSLLFELA